MTREELKELLPNYECTKEGLASMGKYKNILCVECFSELPYCEIQSWFFVLNGQCLSFEEALRVYKKNQFNKEFIDNL